MKEQEKKKERTPKQKWATLRCFQNQGSLWLAYSTIRRVAHCKTTLVSEKSSLAEVLEALYDVLLDWKKNSDISKENYLRQEETK